MDLRSRVVGTHPLNLKRHDVMLPSTIIRNYNGDDIERNEIVSLFSTKFDILSNNNHSELSLQLRAMILIHLNDLLLPLLPLVFEGNTVHNQSKLSLSSLISSNKNRTFSEV